MGAKSCSKSFQTFAFDNNRALEGKSLETFGREEVVSKSCTEEMMSVRVRVLPRKYTELSPRVAKINKNYPPAREAHTCAHQTWT